MFDYRIDRDQYIRKMMVKNFIVPSSRVRNRTVVCSSSDRYHADRNEMSTFIDLDTVYHVSLDNDLHRVMHQWLPTIIDLKATLAADAKVTDVPTSANEKYAQEQFTSLVREYFPCITHVSFRATVADVIFLDGVLLINPSVVLSLVSSREKSGKMLSKLKSLLKNANRMECAFYKESLESLKINADFTETLASKWKSEYLPALYVTATSTVFPSLVSAAAAASDCAAAVASSTWKFITSSATPLFSSKTAGSSVSAGENDVVYRTGYTA